jgi:hypothetical protein
MRRAALPLTRLLLAVLLSAGPLGLEPVFACVMMDLGVHEECCCDDAAGTPCADEACLGERDEGADPCCQTRYQLTTIDADGVQPVTTSRAQDRAGHDPPPAIIPSAVRITQVSTAEFGVRPDWAAPPHLAGTDLYLITLRLRN